MAPYQTPRGSRNWRTFRILGWGAVVLLLGICIVAIYEPLGDSERRVLAWIVAAIVVCAVILATVFSVRQGLRKFKEGLQFELSDGKIIQRCEGKQTVEIALTQVESLHEFPGWLVIKGCEPPRQITIPSETGGFEELKRELSAHRAITVVKARTRLLRFLPLIALIVALSYLLVSQDSAVVLAAGGAVLLLQGLGFHAIWRLRRKALRYYLVLFVQILAWLLTAWVVYERARGTL